MDHQEWIHPSDHDEYELDYSVVFNCHYFLVLREDVQEVDQALQGTQYVRRLGKREQRGKLWKVENMA